MNFAQQRKKAAFREKVRAASDKRKFKKPKFKAPRAAKVKTKSGKVSPIKVLDEYVKERLEKSPGDKMAIEKEVLIGHTLKTMGSK